MNRIFISKILSTDLKSRANVHTLYLSVKDMKLDEVIFDFENVNFATRSFLDEFYNVFIKGHHIKFENVPEEIAIILDTVSRTQNKTKNFSQQENVRSFKTVDEFCSYITSIAF